MSFRGREYEGYLHLSILGALRGQERVVYVIPFYQGDFREVEVVGEFSEVRVSDVECRFLSNQDCGGGLDFAQKVYGFGSCVWLGDMLFYLHCFVCFLVFFSFFFFFASGELMGEFVMEVSTLIQDSCKNEFPELCFFLCRVN